MKEFYHFICVAVCLFNIHSLGVFGIGVNYGLLGNNLPPPRQVISLLQSRKITKIRIFDPNPDVMKALEGSGIEAIIGVRNEDLQRLSVDPSYATQWVNDHVVTYLNTFTFTYITAGNEVIPGPLAGFVLNAIRNLDIALGRANVNNIRVTTVVSTQVLGESFPPSAGVFSEEAGSFMIPIAAYLAEKAIPLLVNVYPFFAYVNDRSNIPVDYALLRETPAVWVIDRNNGLVYRNMFDAIVDSVYSALEKVSASGVEVVVSETGWPSGGGDPDATVGNAETYMNNLVALELSGKGTPKRPGKAVERYIFAVFNENLKEEGVEQNFGLYRPDMTEVYHVNFPA